MFYDIRIINIIFTFYSGKKNRFLANIFLIGQTKYYYYYYITNQDQQNTYIHQDLPNSVSHEKNINTEANLKCLYLTLSIFAI